MINHGIEHGFNYNAYSPTPNWLKEAQFGDGGLTTISRYPIV